MINQTSEKSDFSSEISLINYLEPHWTTYFKGWSINILENDKVLICNNIVDQAGTHSILTKIRDLILPLLTIKKKKDEE